MLRKGISPLIATIMLIAFTLIVAGILSGWATQFATTQRTIAQRCSEARIILQNGVYDSANQTLMLVLYNYGKVNMNFRPIVTYINGSTFAFSDRTINTTAGEIVSDILTGISPNLEQITVQSVECVPPCYYCPGAQDLLLNTNIRGLGG